MELKITDYAIAHWVESVELTVSGASIEKREEVIEHVLEETRRLIQWPRVGQLEVWLADREQEYRRLVVGNFKIIYRIAGDVIHVTDIFDARQDPGRMRG